MIGSNLGKKLSNFRLHLDSSKFEVPDLSHTSCVNSTRRPCNEERQKINTP